MIRKSEDLPESFATIFPGQKMAEYLREIRDPGSMLFGPGFFMPGHNIIGRIL